MLVLSRKPNESIIIRSNIDVFGWEFRDRNVDSTAQQGEEQNRKHVAAAHAHLFIGVRQHVQLDQRNQQRKSEQQKHQKQRGNREIVLRCLLAPLTLISDLLMNRDRW